jgi:hypothetical protein
MQADAGFYGGAQDAMELDGAGEGGKRHIQVIDGVCRRGGEKSHMLPFVCILEMRKEYGFCDREDVQQ